MPQTLIEKIAQRFAVGLPQKHEVHAGDYLSIHPAHCMTHDNTSAVIPKFKSMGATKVKDPGQPVFALDHDIQNTSPENLAKYATIREFAAEQGIAFYPAGRGIGHQVMVEEGHVLPGTFVVASDSHSNLYGGMGALGTPVVRTDAAAIWATGRTWWQVPDIVRVTLNGQLQPGATGKDAIIALCGVFNRDEVLNCCIEFTGPGVAALSLEDRLTIANMTTEWGALAGVFPYDDVTRQYLLDRAAFFVRRHDAHPRLTQAMVRELDARVPQADPDAQYAKEIQFDLAAVSPFVAGPNEVKTITAVTELESKDVRIDKAFIMSCVNGRLQDFEAAAQVIGDQKIADHVKLYIAAASDVIEWQAKERGYWDTLLKAGAIALPPGCGACIGLGEGVLADGEVGISATNRNFKGRMGSRDSFVYLASPAVVAASAVAGKITGPKPGPGGRAAGQPDSGIVMKQAASCQTTPRATETRQQTVEILPGFPERIAGELLLVPKDNMNTDGIYGKEYTYKELKPDEMAQAAMANYDPAFQQIARAGDILIGGYNFGSGSSREQAATALKHRGLQMIIAGSFSQTYKRNAFNNGYICIECPELLDELRSRHGRDRLTIRTGMQATVDFKASLITVQAMAPRGQEGTEAAPAERRTYSFGPLGEVAQELVVKGGFEAVIRDQLKRE